MAARFNTVAVQFHEKKKKIFSTNAELQKYVNVSIFSADLM
jgi:hypothetical protein